MFLLLQRIPKHIVSYLPIKHSGQAYLCRAGFEENKDAEYYISTDGRIRFRYGWPQFAAESGLQVGQTVLIMFDWFEDIVQISVDVVD